MPKLQLFTSGSKAQTQAGTGRKAVSAQTDSAEEKWLSGGRPGAQDRAQKLGSIGIIGYALI